MGQQLVHAGHARPHEHRDVLLQHLLCGQIEAQVYQLCGPPTDHGRPVFGRSDHAVRARHEERRFVRHEETEFAALLQEGDALLARATDDASGEDVHVHATIGQRRLSDLAEQPDLVATILGQLHEVAESATRSGGYGEESVVDVVQNVGGIRSTVRHRMPLNLLGQCERELIGTLSSPGGGRCTVSLVTSLAKSSE